MKNSIHSVELMKEQCIGCTDCIKRCPTEAIRVRNGKAVIRDNLCIDCGMCIRVCRNHAKRAVTDSLEEMNRFNYRVAIPAPSLYAQFDNTNDINVILTAIKRLGFEEVFEVARAAEMVTQKTKEYIRDNSIEKPIVSSACPVISRLISMRFPSLIDNILPILPPMEIAARAAKDYMVKKGIKRKDVGVFFISPCAAKKTNTISPIGTGYSDVDCVLSISDLYIKLRGIISKMKASEVENLSLSGKSGVNWALIGGESKSVEIENAIAVDGMENVIKILEEAEDGQLEHVDFIEALACPGGCIGGPLTLTNSFIAKNRMKKLNNFFDETKYSQIEKINMCYNQLNYSFTEKIIPDEESLNSNMAVALEMLEEIERVYKNLPSIDCGSCGAPTCQALAEDVVKGLANEEDCVFVLRTRIRELAESMVDLSKKMPHTVTDDFRNRYS